MYPIQERLEEKTRELEGNVRELEGMTRELEVSLLLHLVASNAINWYYSFQVQGRTVQELQQEIRAKEEQMVTKDREIAAKYQENAQQRGRIQQLQNENEVYLTCTRNSWTHRHY